MKPISKLFSSILFVAVAASTTLAQEDRPVKRLSDGVSQLVDKHFKDLDRVDQREIRRSLRKIKNIFEDYGYYPDDSPQTYKYYTAKCKVNGFGDNGTVGPATSIEALLDWCQKSKPPKYKNDVYLDGVKSAFYPKGKYIQAKCRSSKPKRYEYDIYLSDITVLDI